MENGDDIVSQCGTARSSDPLLRVFHESRDAPIQARVIKDAPFMRGFGKELKVGDFVTIKGTVYGDGMFQVCVPAECAFYDYTHFEPIRSEEVEAK